MRLVPVDANRKDWPRLVANKINDLDLRARNGSAWAVYSDTGAAQSIAASTRSLLTINAGSKIEDQLSADIPALWDATSNSITGLSGDDRAGRIKFIVTPQDGTCSYIDAEFDIGGGLGVIDEIRFPISVGALVDKAISFPFEMYCGDTFEANGCRIYLTSDGPIEVSGKSILIKRSHRAK